MSCKTCNIDLKNPPKFSYPKDKPVSDNMRKAVEGARLNAKGSVNRSRNKRGQR